LKGCCRRTPPSCIIDFETSLIQVRGLGQITLRSPQGEATFNNGDRFPCDVLIGGKPNPDRQAESAQPRSTPVFTDKPNHSFWDRIHALEAEFHEGLKQQESRKATNALLELDRTLWQAQVELENEEFIAQARDTFRDLIALYGIKLDASPRNEAENLATLVDGLLELRENFRMTRNWDAADAIRDVLQRVNIIVEDDKDGSTWRRDS
jgi:cysteinyl-tRNA synthetase